MKTRQTKPTKKRDSYRLNPALILRVQTVAKRQGWTKTFIIETALARVLPEMEKREPFLEPQLQLAGFAE